MGRGRGALFCHPRRLCLRPWRLAAGGIEGCPYDTGLVQAGRRQQGSPGGYLVDELVHLGGAAATQDEEIRGEEKFESRQIVIEALAPLSPAQILALAHRVGAVVLGDHPLQHQMAQLGVGQQVAVHKHGGADAGADRNQDDHPLVPLALAEAHLGNACRIGIVKYKAGQAGDLAKQSLGVGLDPARVYIRGTLGNPVMDDGRKAAPYRAFPVEVLDQRLEGVGDGRRGCRLRGGDAVAFADELSRCGIDQASLDAASTDIDSQNVHALLLVCTGDGTG